MAKRPADDLTVIFENVGESSQAPPQRRRIARPRATPRAPPPLYHASAEDVADAGAIATGSSAAEDLDNAILQRIKKCLARAHHPGTPEAEAKAALHLASRLMGQYNVSQAEVLAHEPPSARQQYAGQSVVSIRRTDGDTLKPVRQQGYVDNICTAMVRFFDCKSYTSSRRSALDVIFYGIGENTIAAAMSFEMVFNLINEWAQTYKGGNPRNSYLLGLSSSLASMAWIEKAAEEDRAQRAEVDAIAAKEQEEQAERQAQLDRMAPLRESPPNVHPKLESDANAGLSSGNNGSDSISPFLGDASHLSDSESGDGFNFDDDFGSSGESSDSEDSVEPDFKVEEGEHVDPFGDLDDEVQRLIKTEPGTSDDSSRPWSAPLALPAPQGGKFSPARSTTGTRPAKTESTSIKTESTSIKTESTSIKGEKQEPDEEPKWASHMQLVTFRATAAKIADEYLEKKGEKLRNGPIRSLNIRDRNAYWQGKADSKKIDVRRRRIAEGP